MKKVVVDATGGDNLDKIVRGIAQAIASGISPEDLIIICDVVSAAKLRNLSITGPQIIQTEIPVELPKSQRAKLQLLCEKHPIGIGLSLLQATDGFFHRQAKCPQAGAFVSAGSTKKIVGLAPHLLSRLRIAGRFKTSAVRPAIAAICPHAENCLFADVGASPGLEPIDYVRLAFLCTAYAIVIFKIERPAVRLLNIGEENDVGGQTLIEANRLLRACPEINFLGNCQGYDIAKPPTDTNIILTSAETGNPCLKLWEADHPDLAQLVGGLPLLGFHGNVIIAHGSSSAEKFAKAILAAYQLANSDLIPTTIEMLKGKKE